MNLSRRITQAPLLVTVTTLVILAASLMTLSKPQAAQAQSCPSTDSAKGLVSFDIAIQEAGQYRVWTRMQAGNSHNNSVWLKLDNGCAINVGNTAVPSDSWKWVDYRDGSTSKKVNLTLSAGTHKLRYYGKEKNVKVDTVVLLKDSSCIPEGKDGKNCQVASSTSSDDSSDSNGSGATSTSGNAVRVGDVIITPDGEQVAIEGQDEQGAYYTDDDGNRVYAQEELTQAEAEELGYLPGSSSRTPWYIGLGIVLVLSIGVVIYTVVRPEQAKHIVDYQHRLVAKLKSFFTNNKPPNGGVSPDSSTTVYPSKRAGTNAN